MIIIFWILVAAWIIDMTILIYAIRLGRKAERLFKSVMNNKKEIYRLQMMEMGE
jgi:hypothetical protein